MSCIRQTASEGMWMNYKGAELWGCRVGEWVPGVRTVLNWFVIWAAARSGFALPATFVSLVHVLTLVRDAVDGGL